MVDSLLLGQGRYHLSVFILNKQQFLYYVTVNRPLYT